MIFVTLIIIAIVIAACVSSRNKQTSQFTGPQFNATLQKNTNNLNTKHASDIMTDSTHKEISVPERMEKEPMPLSSEKPSPIQSNYEAYYKNGILFNVNPRNKNVSLYEDRQTAYDARYIISDNIKYDLENAESISSLLIPNFQGIKGGMPNVTHDLSYLFKMRVGTENRPQLAVPLAYKAANLMIASPIGWTKKDYYRLVIQLWSIGEIKYGDHLLAELKKLLPFVAAENYLNFMHKESFNKQLSFSTEFTTDYVYIDYSGAVCEKCAPYQNRVYSISGKDKKFPKLPEFILHDKGIHCGMSIHPFFYYAGCTLTKYLYLNKNEVKSQEVDAIKYSNRPFIDDRSEFEKQLYEEQEKRQKERQKADEQYYNREHWIEKYHTHLEYQEISNVLGDKAPKSFSGYMRMKKNNTANFQKIFKFAEENGIKITPISN